jgi:hypothetical protein
MFDSPRKKNLQNCGNVVLGIPELASSGMNSKSAPATARESTWARDVKGMSIEEMESELAQKSSKRVPEASSNNAHAPHTARTLLEENKQLIEEKQKKKALARKSSREEFERLIARDRLSAESDKANEQSRKQAHIQLANTYKEKIGKREQAKADAYTAKIKDGIDIQYFPWVEGETIDKHREAKTSQLREEMREHMKKQREERPARMDPLQADCRPGHTILYPTGQGIPEEFCSAVPSKQDDEFSPYMAKNPRFLSRAQEHMSRRLHDDHVRKALEDKVSQSMAELEGFQKQRQAEVQAWEEGLMVTDALRYDRDRAKAAERRRNAEFLERQMHENEAKQKDAKKDYRARDGGYWGPEEKALQSGDLHRDHCADLIKQMEVDQLRKISSRQQRLKQEKRLIDNSIEEMAQDRQKQKVKAVQVRQVLTTTWKSQVKIRQAKKNLDAIL